MRLCKLESNFYVFIERLEQLVDISVRKCVQIPCKVIVYYNFNTISTSCPVRGVIGPAIRGPVEIDGVLMKLTE